MPSSMIALVLTVLGCCTLGFGLYKANQLRRILGTGKLKQAWDILTVMIGVFLLAYLAFVAYMFGLILPDVVMSPLAQTLTAVVFFLGGVFVAAVTHLNTNVFRG
ncbi:MAG: hypothetical protein SVU32_08775 [Candidatus Nanohaloarchaea archaeon]|nr:hypothetical protein [Candidatus Nanohaloarchaea archaeon]